MIAFFILFVAFTTVITFVLIVATNAMYDEEAPFFCVLGGISGGFATSLGIMALLIGSLIPTVPAIHTTTKTYNLVNLKTMGIVNSSFSGDFFLGTGTISGSTETSSEYVYYYQLPDGGYKLGKLSTDENITIYQQDRKDGKLVITDRKQDPCPDNIWMFPNCTTANDFSTTYAFYIPKGSIRTSFSIG